MTTDFLLSLISALAGAAIALIVALRAGRSITRWAFVAGMTLLAVESLCNGIGAIQTSVADVVAWQKSRLLAASFFPGIWLFFSLSYSRGNASEFRMRWRYAVAAALLAPPALAVGFYSLLLVGQSSPSGLLQVGLPGLVLYVLLLLGSVLVLVHLERTFRASVGTMRWRIKFMLMGLGLLFLVRLYTSSQVVVFRALDPHLETLNAGALLLACVMIARSLFREGHFEKDVYPSHAVLYNSLTFLLTGVYLVVVGVAAQLLTYFGGDDAFTLKAFLTLVALVGLALLLQSDHVRLSLRQFISRNFQRPFYDYRSVWRKFTSETSMESDPEERCHELARLIAEVFEALSVTIWLFEDGNERLALAASTSVSQREENAALPTGHETRELLARIETDSGPFEIETPQETWAAALRRCHPTEFAHGGIRVCVPLIGRGEPLGCVIIGDRVSGIPFSSQDFDMLKCVGDHAAASLLADKLSQRLLQARELEAFQAMAAFFIHDLKNVATTLNLMVKNLPVHFDDPEFRADALRGIARTGTQMKNLIARLDHLRGGLQVEAVDADLNHLIRQSLEGWNQKPGIKVTTDLGNVPPVSVDPEQISKVATNLIINAVEATADDGSVHVSTRCEGKWAVLAVKDTGCGMTEEFLNKSLFRAFQTSKKGGMGIGMFQSKMVVEAHGGRIAVESAPGKGTTFQVFLPLATSLPPHPPPDARREAVVETGKF